MACGLLSAQGEMVRILKKIDVTVYLTVAGLIFAILAQHYDMRDHKSNSPDLGHLGVSSIICAILAFILLGTSLLINGYRFYLLYSSD